MLVAIELFAMVVEAAMPYALVFAVGQRLVTFFLTAAFGGYVKI